MVLILLLVGITKDGKSYSYNHVNNYNKEQLEEMNSNKDWIYKVIEIDTDNIEEYKELNNKMSLIDLYDNEFDVVLSKIHSIEKRTMFLSDYINTIA